MVNEKRYPYYGIYREDPLLTHSFILKHRVASTSAH